MTRFARISGTGSCLPPQRLTNADMVARLAARGVEADETRADAQGLAGNPVALARKLFSQVFSGVHW